MDGHIPIARSLFRDPPGILRSHEHSRAYFDLGEMARFRSGDGLQIGELRAAESFLANRWHWSKAKVRRFLDALGAEGLIARFSPTDEEKARHEPGKIRLLRYAEHFVIEGTEAKRGPNREVERGNDVDRTLLDDSRTAPRSAQRTEVEEGLKKKASEKNGKAYLPSAERSGPTLDGWMIEEAMDGGADALVAALPELRLSPEDAEWVCETVEALQVKGAMTDEWDASAIARMALGDMVRKGYPFTRRRFEGFYKAKLRFGSPGDVDDTVSAAEDVFDPDTAEAS